MDNTDNLLPQAAQDETPGLRRASRIAVSQQAEAAASAKAMPPDCYDMRPSPTVFLPHRYCVSCFIPRITLPHGICRALTNLCGRRTPSALRHLRRQLLLWPCRTLSFQRRTSAGRAQSKHWLLNAVRTSALKVLRTSCSRASWLRLPSKTDASARAQKVPSTSRHSCMHATSCCMHATARETTLPYGNAVSRTPSCRFSSSHVIFSFGNSSAR